MADLDVRSIHNIQDKRKGRGIVASANTPLAEVANMKDVNSLRTRLTAISATKYSAARLATMTVNDMIYAVRLETADAAGI